MDFAQTVLSVCGAVSIIGGAVAVVWKWIAPAVKLNDRVKVLEEHDKRDYKALTDIANRDALILEALLTMIDSQISGNNTEQLKKTKEKLYSHLAEK